MGGSPCVGKRTHMIFDDRARVKIYCAKDATAGGSVQCLTASQFPSQFCLPTSVLA